MNLQKRDEMLSHTLEENRKLKEITLTYEKMKYSNNYNNNNAMPMVKS